MKNEPKLNGKYHFKQWPNTSPMQVTFIDENTRMVYYQFDSDWPDHAIISGSCTIFDFDMKFAPLITIEGFEI